MDYNDNELLLIELTEYIMKHPQRIQHISFHGGGERERIYAFHFKNEFCFVSIIWNNRECEESYFCFNTRDKQVLITNQKLYYFIEKLKAQERDEAYKRQMDNYIKRVKKIMEK